MADAVFEYRRPLELEHAHQALALAQQFNEKHAPIRAAQAAVDAMASLLQFMERREQRRQLIVFERKNPPAQAPAPRRGRRRTCPRPQVTENQIREMLADGGLDTWIFELTGVSRQDLKRLRRSAGFAASGRGGSYTDRREGRKAFMRKWRPILQGEPESQSV